MSLRVNFSSFKGKHSRSVSIKAKHMVSFSISINRIGSFSFLYHIETELKFCVNPKPWAQAFADLSLIRLLSSTLVHRRCSPFFPSSRSCPNLVYGSLFLVFIVLLVVLKIYVSGSSSLDLVHLWSMWGSFESPLSFLILYVWIRIG